MSDIEIHLYGKLRKLAENSSPTADSVLKLDWKPNETVAELIIQRLNLSLDKVGEIFVNHKPVDVDTIIPNEARLGLFQQGMYLLCGGQHMKGHGFITSKKAKKKKMDYWQTEQEQE